MSARNGSIYERAVQAWVSSRSSQQSYIRLPPEAYENSSRRGFILSRWRKAISIVRKIVVHRSKQNIARSSFVGDLASEDNAKLMSEVAKFRVPIEEWKTPRGINTGLFFPSGPRKTAWDVCILVCICYAAVAEPFQLAFDVQVTGWAFGADLLIDFAFLADVAATFNTAIRSNDGTHFIVSRIIIGRTYLAGWFWIDLPSSIPGELIEVWSRDDNSDIVKVRGCNRSPRAQPCCPHILLPSQSCCPHILRAPVQVLRVLKILRLMRLLKLFKLLARINELMEDHLGLNMSITAIFKVSPKHAPHIPSSPSSCG